MEETGSCERRGLHEMLGDFGLGWEWEIAFCRAASECILQFANLTARSSGIVELRLALKLWKRRLFLDLI